MNIRDIFRKNRTTGLIGIEIEVEGDRLPEEIAGWRKEHDGSLRGESAEFVLPKPIARDKVEKALEAVTKAYKANRTNVLPSNRTSIHIHLNVQEFTATQVFNFAAIYAILEKPLIDFCGPQRVGNLFCLRFCDADYLADALVHSVTEARLHELGRDNLRYAAFNVAALAKYGSLEFRALRGTKDMSVIGNWIDILLAIRDAALEYDNPRQVVEALSMNGEMEFAQSILGRHTRHLTLNPADLMDGVRIAQDFAYATDWATFEAKVARRYG